MTLMETLLDIIQNFTAADVSSSDESTNLRRDLGLDSLQIASIAGEVEEAFGVEISDADAADAVTVGDFLRLAMQDAE